MISTEITTDTSRAAELILQGEVVALPTETVYGLAGNALDPAAIGRIFAAKNRPRDNPLIVHIADTDMIGGLGLEFPPIAARLAERFWGGPLTMVLKRNADCPLPPEISCGLDSAAVRVPNSPVMREVIRLCARPLAAPSANLSGSPSPTTAQHVRDDLQGRIPLIIDGGACKVGIESTVVAFEVASEVVRILRPGTVTAEMLGEFGQVVESGDSESPLSPGTRHKHYSPKAQVIAVMGGAEQIIGLGEYTIPAPDTRTLFAKLREFDKLGADKIYVRLPDKSGIGLALYNRIIRAAEFRVVEL